MEAFGIKTHGSESWGQERAKQIAKNKMHDELLCLLHEQTIWHHNHSQYLSTHVNF